MLIVLAVPSSGYRTAGLVTAALLAPLFSALRAQATELRIHCPALDEEARAALEARARAEMAANPQSTEEIAIDCLDDSAVVTQRLAGAAGSGWRRVPLPPDQALAVDDLLAAVHTLRSEASRPLGGQGSEPPAGARVRDRVPSLRSSERRSVAFGAIVGVGGLLWHGAIGEALGPRIGLRLSGPRHWSTDLVAGLAWGLTAASGLSARAYEASWTIHYAPIAWLDVGLGGDLFALTASLSGAGATSQSAVTGGAVVQARYVLHGGPLSFSLGPQLEVLAHPIVVEAAQVDVLRVSNLVAGLLVDAEGDLIR